MGNLFKKITGPKSRVIMQGLDAAGKTTILYKVSNKREIVTTIPTIGFNVETLFLKNGVEMTTWDVGGRDKIRPLWRHYYQNTSGLIFVIDSNDHDRLSSTEYGSAKTELHSMLAEEQLAGLPLLIFANKQDLPKAMSIKQIEEGLDLSAFAKTRKIHIQPSCAVSGDGLAEGFDWLNAAMEGKPVASSVVNADEKNKILNSQNSKEEGVAALVAAVKDQTSAPSA